MARHKHNVADDGHYEPLFTYISYDFEMKSQFVSYHLIVFDAVRVVEASPDEVEQSPDEVKSHHWSKRVCPLLTCNQ